MRYLWKNSFFVHMFKNINVSRNITLFWDHFEKVDFCYISENIHISRKTSLETSFLKIVFINNSKKESFYDITFEKSLFVHICESIKIQGTFLEISLKNSYLSKNINTLRKITLFWYHFEKIVLFLYIRKYKYFEEKIVI